MHIPRQFKQNDESQLIALMREYPFATLITQSEKAIEATHLPVILAKVEGQYRIQGHIAKANKIWKSVKEGAEILLIFNGPNCYVSPNYYPTKKISGKAVPTWNYVVVHVKGSISFIDDEKWIYNMIDTLTNLHESNQELPWSLTDAPDIYIKSMLSAIVGIEISIDAIEGQWKLSQNQPHVNQLGVVEALSAKGDAHERDISKLITEQI